MRRRTLFGGLAAVSVIPAFGGPALADPLPKPQILEHECLSRFRQVSIGQSFSDILHADFLRLIEFVPSRRTAATQRRALGAKYTFEMAYDGLSPSFYDQIVRDISWVIMSEVAAELALIQPVHLVAFDTPGVKIDLNTFEPYLGFYLDHNV